MTENTESEGRIENCDLRYSKYQDLCAGRLKMSEYTQFMDDDKYLELVKKGLAT